MATIIQDNIQFTDVLQPSFVTSGRIARGPYTIDDQNNAGLQKIKVEISAKIHSYYIMEYKIIRQPEDEIRNQMYSSIDYLIPVFQNDKEGNYGNKTVIGR